MAVIKSGATSDQLTIGPVNKAARVIQYDALGNDVSQKETYRAAIIAPLATAVTANVPWFVMQGSASKTIRVQRIKISRVVSTAAAYLQINLAKYSTNATGGTSTTLTLTPLDSNSGASTSGGIRIYTAAPTAGTKVGDLSSTNVLSQSTTVAASAVPNIFDLDFRGQGGETSAIVLRGNTQEIALYYPVAAGAGSSIGGLEIEWTEE